MFSTEPDFYLSVPCGRCYLCKRKRAQHWKLRLQIELDNTRTHLIQGKQTPRAIFLTFTFNEEHYHEPEEQFTDWVVKFRDNYRKKFGKSPRYFAVSDCGSQFGRIHFHMLLFDPRVYDRRRKEYTRDISVSELHKLSYWWPFGYVTYDAWCKSGATADYVAGYISGSNLYKEEPVKHGKPICEQALRYKPKIYCSKGLGMQICDSTLYAKISRNNFQYIDYRGYVYGVPRSFLNRSLDYFGNLTDSVEHWTTISGDDKIHNGFAREIVRHRQAITKAEEVDYYIRHNFDTSKYRVVENGRSISLSLWRSGLQLTEKFLTPLAEKPPTLLYHYKPTHFFDNWITQPELFTNFLTYE